MGLRPWHVALAGLVAHLAYSLWAFLDYRASGTGDALSLAAGTLVLLLLLGAGSAGIVPTVLLARGHRIAHWVSLGLGAAYLVTVFLAIEGLFLVAAGLWQWRRRQPRATGTGVTPS